MASEMIDEVARVDAVKSLGMLDTPPEERFDRYTRLARRVFGVPIALISLVDERRVWIKSKSGFDEDEVPREQSFCSQTVSGGDLLMVTDASKDERFKNSPLVSQDPGIRFYAGCPIRTTKGLLVATLCVLDYEVRDLSDQDQRLLKDLAAMVEEEITMYSLATIDELTRLSNRRGFQLIANHTIAMCKRMEKPASLMFFDLDRFKHVNDTYGHAEGDKVLQDLGQILLHEFRNSDVIARLGGDEFCVLLTGTAATGVDRPIANLDRAINARNQKNSYEIAYSVGAVTYDASIHHSIEDLLAEADKLMYENKRLSANLGVAT